MVGTSTTVLSAGLKQGHAGARPLCRHAIWDYCAMLLKGYRLAPLMVDSTEYEHPPGQQELIKEIAPYWRGSGLCTEWETDSLSGVKQI